MSRTRDFPWLRIGAESVAIVGSILLAFAIDAWWQQRGERAQALTLVANLTTDFKSNQQEVERVLIEHRKNFLAADALLRNIVEAEPGGEITIPMSQVIGAVMGPTFGPATATLDHAISTGQIGLIEDADLRSALGRWRQKVADNVEEEVDLRNLGHESLLPEFSRQLRFGRFLNANTIEDWRTGSTDEIDFSQEVRLTVNSELEGYLSQRVFLANFVVEEVGQIAGMQAQILDLLEEY